MNIFKLVRKAIHFSIFLAFFIINTFPSHAGMIKFSGILQDNDEQMEPCFPCTINIKVFGINKDLSGEQGEFGEMVMTEAVFSTTDETGSFKIEFTDPRENIEWTSANAVIIDEDAGQSFRFEDFAEPVQDSAMEAGGSANIPSRVEFGEEYKSVPEPLTILGSGLALGFGAYFKKEYSRKQKKAKTKD